MNDPTEKPKQIWITQDCATPGCYSIIRYRLGTLPDPPLCKWCQAGTSHARNTSSLSE